MSGLKRRRQTTVAEWLIGIGFTLVAVLAALALLAPPAWQRALEERDAPLRSVDESWVEIGPASPPLEAFLRFVTQQAIHDQAGKWRGAGEPA